MKDKRVPGQSQLDYLWTTYGPYAVSSVLENEPSEYLPTQELLQSLLSQISNSSGNLLSIKGNNLILYSITGEELSRVDISELKGNSSSIVDYGSKIVIQEDIDKGCPFNLGSKVYYIALDNGKIFYAEQETPSVFLFVDKLPEIGESNKMYIIQNENTYSMYLYNESKFILLGSSEGLSQEIIQKVDQLTNNLTWQDI